MSQTFKKIVTNLTTWVILALITGILLGHFAPSTAIQLQPLGTYFIAVIKLFINPIIFVTIILGLSGMGDVKQVGRIGGKTIIYFEIITTFALIIGIIVANLIQPGHGVSIPDPGSADLSPYTSKVSNFGLWSFLRSSITIQVLIVAIVIGLTINRFNFATLVKKYLQLAANYLFKALHIIMLFAPIGALGGMAFTIGKFGLVTLLPLAKLMITVYMTMAIFVFVVLGLVMRYYHVSLIRFLNYIKEELLIVLGTSSSESALPSLMEKLEKMGCSKPIVGLVIPSGYSFNLDGTTIYLSMAIIFLAQVYDIHLTTDQMITIIGVLMVTSKGAAGVTGSGFVVLASTMSAVGVIPMDGLALLLGVDRFMSEARSITNFIGNGVATIFIANHEGTFDRTMMESAFGKEIYEYNEV